MRHRSHPQPRRSLVRSKSAASVHRPERELTHIDPNDSYRDARIAAAVSFARTKQREPTGSTAESHACKRGGHAHREPFRHVSSVRFTTSESVLPELRTYQPRLIRRGSGTSCSNTGITLCSQPSDATISLCDGADAYRREGDNLHLFRS